MVEFLLESLDLSQSSQMPLFGSEFRTCKSVDKFQGCLGPDDAAPQHERVRIVVLDTLVRGANVVAEPRANPPHFIGGDRRAHARAADQHAPLRTAIEHRAAYLFGEVRIIYRVRCGGPYVENLVSLAGEVIREIFLQIQTGMVRPERQFHGLNVRR